MLQKIYCQTYFLNVFPAPFEENRNLILNSEMNVRDLFSIRGRYKHKKVSFCIGHGKSKIPIHRMNSFQEKKDKFAESIAGSI